MLGAMNIVSCTLGPNVPTAFNTIKRSDNNIPSAETVGCIV